VAGRRAARQLLADREVGANIAKTRAHGRYPSLGTLFLWNEVVSGTSFGVNIRR
jgi:hypothetical protein